MKDVQTVIWDCDNLMWFHKEDEADILARALKIQDIQNFEKEFWNMLIRINSELADKKNTFDAICKIVEKSMPILSFNGILPKQFMNVWDESKFEMNTLNEDIFPVMEYLQDKGLKSIIKTDWLRDVQLDMLNQYGILKYIERIYACDNSYLKCNPLSAREIVKSGEEEQYIIIGDSLESDICFANHAGIRSIWFNKNKRINNTAFKPTHQITSLLEVMQIL